jgi:hypothetical protein
MKGPDPDPDPVLEAQKHTNPPDLEHWLQYSVRISIIAMNRSLSLLAFTYL